MAMIFIFDGMTMQPSHRNVIRNLRKISNQYKIRSREVCGLGFCLFLYSHGHWFFSIISTGSAQHNEGNSNFSIQVFERAEMLLRF